jgi:hypothetical protein
MPEALEDDNLAKFVLALSESTGFSASAKKSVSAALTTLLQENRKENPYLHISTKTI